MPENPQPSVPPGDQLDRVTPPLEPTAIQSTRPEPRLAAVNEELRRAEKEQAGAPSQAAAGRTGRGARRCRSPCVTRSRCGRGILGCRPPVRLYVRADAGRPRRESLSDQLLSQEQLAYRARGWPPCRSYLDSAAQQLYELPISPPCHRQSRHRQRSCRPQICGRRPRWIQ